MCQFIEQWVSEKRVEKEEDASASVHVYESMLIRELINALITLVSVLRVMPPLQLMWVTITESTVDTRETEKRKTVMCSYKVYGQHQLNASSFCVIMTTTWSGVTSVSCRSFRMQRRECLLKGWLSWGSYLCCLLQWVWQVHNCHISIGIKYMRNICLFIITACNVCRATFLAA